MQTRSTKNAALAQSPQTPSKPLTKEKVPDPMVRPWDHGDQGNMEGITIKPPRFIPVETSLDSLFYGSLSSIDSPSTGGSSFSSVEDGPVFSSQASSTVAQRAAGGHLMFVAGNGDSKVVPATPHHSATGPTRVARGTAKRGHAKRPYPAAVALTGSSRSLALPMLGSPTRALPRRDTEINSNSDPVYGATPVAGTGGSHRARTASASLDPNDIFQREMQILFQSKELALAGVKAVRSETKGKKSRTRTPQQPTPTRMKPLSTRHPLGPEGTELIDESFRAAPAGPSVYPQDWVTRLRSTLHPHPTLVEVGAAGLEVAVGRNRRDSGGDDGRRKRRGEWEVVWGSSRLGALL